jgi:hypothetical protein
MKAPTFLRRWLCSERKPDVMHSILMRELRELDPENPRLRFVEECFRG